MRAYLEKGNDEITNKAGRKPCQNYKGSEHMTYTGYNLTELENRIIIELLKGNTENEIASITGVTEKLISGRVNRILDMLCGGLSNG